MLWGYLEELKRARFLGNKIFILKQKMIRQEIYEKVSDTFGVSIGVANIMSVSPITEIKEDIPKEVYNSYKNELKINEVIGRAIDSLKYRELQLEIYRLRKEYGNRKISELTIYNKAWEKVLDKPTKVRNGNTKAKSESGEILKERG